MLPKAVPELTEEQFEFLTKEIKRKPSTKEIKQFNNAKAIYQKYSPK